MVFILCFNILFAIFGGWLLYRLVGVRIYKWIENFKAGEENGLDKKTKSRQRKINKK